MLFCVAKPHHLQRIGDGEMGFKLSIANHMTLRAKAPGQNTLNEDLNVLGMGALHIIHTNSDLEH